MKGTQDNNVQHITLEWTPRGPVQQAFGAFAIEGLIPGVTPFGDPGAFGYDDTVDVLGVGNHPVMTYVDPGSSLSIEPVESTFSEPLVPERP